MSDGQDVLRILISTDNHLGVWEKDEVRGDDSFNTMDEVLCIAKREKVDFVLLGGDLFHDNKPSRQTVVKAMEIFARHCMSDDPVGFRVISDQRQNFASGRVNFENSNYNIGLPVFTIHGNHDDPGGTENLSAVDILSTGALLNYFGKVAIAGEGVGKVRIAPVLIQKGATKLALFGLGNLRDERLCRLFQTPACVEWIRPADTPDYPRDEWFNLFVLHQNRTPHSQGAKNYVKESHLARFLDLVIWGHEHECLADPWDSVETGGAFSVLQPGSSVATALSEGEAKRKHVVVLEIMGHHWRTIKHPLETVRRFEFETVVLAEHTKKLDPEDPETVTAFLDARVSAMIARAVRGRPPASPKLPLVRLRVDYTGFSTINTQRFGTRFVGQVANPHDIVLWQKPPARRAREESATRAGNAPVVPIRPEALDEAHIEDLVSQHLQHDLELLPEVELAEALHEFVDKENRNALSEAVSRVLEETQAAAAARGGEETGTSAAGEGRGGARGGADAAVPSGPTSPSRQGVKPAKPEEGEVLESIARATARRRLSHGLGSALRGGSPASLPALSGLESGGRGRGHQAAPTPVPSTTGARRPPRGGDAAGEAPATRTTPQRAHGDAVGTHSRPAAGGRLRQGALRLQPASSPNLASRSHPAPNRDLELAAGHSELQDADMSEAIFTDSDGDGGVLTGTRSLAGARQQPTPTRKRGRTPGPPSRARDKAGSSEARHQERMVTGSFVESDADEVAVPTAPRRRKAGSRDT
ncbi:MRE11 [Auxenochlorella protothecoides x Auxenochlorella symbiontica]